MNEKKPQKIVCVFFKQLIKSIKNILRQLDHLVAIYLLLFFAVKRGNSLHTHFCIRSEHDLVI